MEIWKDVVGYEGRYLVSNFGEVKSMPKPKCKREKTLKSMLSKAGYLMVDLGDGKAIKRFLVHRLVAMAFIENPLNKEQVNHIDGNKCNNNLDNLEWNTRSENQLHSFRIGLRSKIISENAISAAKKANSKQIKGVNIKDKSILLFKSMADARKQGFNVGNISACCLGKRLKHKGYTWEFQPVTKF